MNRSSDAPDVGSSRTYRRAVFVLPVRPSSAPPVRGRIDVIDVPRGGSDRRADPESLVLAADERLEVIVDDGFAQGRELCVTPRVKEDRVPAETIGLACDGGLGAME